MTTMSLPHPCPSTNSQSAERPSILIADDDPSTADLFAMLLAADPIDILAVADGRAALQLWRDHHPDLLLIDMRMPYLNAERGMPNAEKGRPKAERRAPNAERGRPNAQPRTPNAESADLTDSAFRVHGSAFKEVCRQVRAVDRHIPLVLISAADDLATMERGYALGADQYLLKPIVDYRPIRLYLLALLRRAGCERHQRDQLQRGLTQLAQHITREVEHRGAPSEHLTQAQLIITHQEQLTSETHD